MKIHKAQSKLKVTLLASSMVVLLVSQAVAKNGPFPHGIGSQFGMGGSGTALAIESSNAEANPAVLSHLDTQVSLFFINYFQTQSVDSSRAPAGNSIGEQKNRLKNSPALGLDGNYVVNDKWAVGFATSGGAANIKYNAPTVSPAALSPAGSTFNNEFINSIMLMMPTVSYRRTADDSYGFSLILGRQTLKTNLATASVPATQTTGALRVDTSTGIGARIGGWWKVAHFLSLGASASTPVSFTKFKKYLDVFPYAPDLPAIIRAGVAFHAGQTDYLFDIKQIFYSPIKALGKGLGWKNQTVFMVGAQHRLTPAFILTAGYNYGNSPVRSNNVLVNSLSIPIAVHHFTIGARYRVTKCVEMIAGLEFTPIRRMTDDGSGLLGSLAQGTRLKNRDVAVLFGGTYHFSK